MKKLFIALSLIGLVQFSANAQSKNAQNYKICLKGDKYQVCDGSSTPRAMKKQKAKDAHTIASLRRMDTYVHLGYSSSAAFSNKRNPRIMVSMDDPQAPYKGEESRINDGVKKNIDRNVNYLDNSIVLPANDGGSPLR